MNIENVILNITGWMFKIINKINFNKDNNLKINNNTNSIIKQFAN